MTLTTKELLSYVFFYSIQSKRYIADGEVNKLSWERLAESLPSSLIIFVATHKLHTKIRIIIPLDILPCG